MRARIVKIGNSQGIRIPKPWLEGSGIQDEVELRVEGTQLIIKPIENTRKGWEVAFSANRVKDEKDFKEYQSLSNQWDQEEWQWE